MPDRSGGMDDKFGGEFESGGDAGFSGFATIEFPAGFPDGKAFEAKILIFLPGWIWR